MTSPSSFIKLSSFLPIGIEEIWVLCLLFLGILTGFLEADKFSVFDLFSFVIIGSFDFALIVFFVVLLRLLVTLLLNLRFKSPILEA